MPNQADNSGKESKGKKDVFADPFKLETKEGPELKSEVSSETKPEGATNIETEDQAFDKSIDYLEGLLAASGLPTEEEITELSEEEKALSMDQLRERVDTLVAERETAELTVRAILEGQEVKEAIKELQSLKIESEADIERMIILLASLSSAVYKIKENLDAIPVYNQRAELLNKHYSKTRLQETGFSSQSELDQKIDELENELSRLKGEFFKRVFSTKHRQRIAELSAEQDQLWPLSYDLLHRKVPSIYTGTYRSDKDKLIESVTKVVIEKIQKRYESLLGQEAVLKEEPVAEELVDALNNNLRQDFFARLGEQKIEFTEKGKINSYFIEKLEELSNPDDVENLEELIKLVNRDGFNPYSSDQKEIFDRLPYSLQGFCHSFFGQIRQPTRFYYQEMTNYVRNIPTYQKVNTAERSYKHILERLSATILASRDVPYEIRDLTWEFRQRQNNLERRTEVSAKKLQQFVNDYPPDLWDMFAYSQEVNQRFGESQVEQANVFLAQIIRDELLKEKDRSEKAISLGYKLLHFKDKETVPIVVLNAYRESGHSGERPFLLNMEPPSETDLFKYLASLSEENLEALERENIPGLVEVIRTVKENPDNFCHYRIEDPETKDYVPNPSSRKIEQGLAQMSLHYLEQGDNKTQFFILGLLRQLKGDLGEANYAKMAEILRQSQDLQVRDELMDNIKWRARYKGDTKAAEILLRNYNYAKAEVKNLAPTLVKAFVGKKEINPESLGILGRVLGVSVEELSQAINFIAEVEGLYESGWGVAYGGENKEELRRYIELAKNSEILPLVKELSQYGYGFHIDHDAVLPEMVARKEEIIAAIKEIRKNFSDFRYSLPAEDEYDPNTHQSKRVYQISPFEALASQYKPADFFKQLYKIQEKEGGFSQEFSNGFLRHLRHSDPRLREALEVKQKIEASSFSQFHEGIQALVKETNDPKGQLQKYKECFFSYDILRFLARQPNRAKEVLILPQETPYLFNQLLAEGGPLYTNRDNIIKDVFNNGDIVRRAKEIETIFTKRVPYWKQLYLFTEARIGEQLAAAATEYPIEEIARVSLARVVERHKEIKAKNPAELTRLESMVRNQSVRDRLVAGEIDSVPFSSLSGIYKRIVFRDYLKGSIESSRSSEVKKKADIRNREFTTPGLNLQEGMYIHGSAIDHLDSVLLSGNLPQEALGEGAETDSYPFQVDFTRLQSEFLKNKDSTVRVFTESLSGSYGIGGRLGADGQIFYLYRRDQINWQRGKEYSADSGEHHALVLGGMPATEIGAIILRSEEKTLEQAKKSVLENGFYIPIYNLKGELIFSQEEYDQAVKDLNLTVPVEVWDFSLKTGEQKGSNPGGEFTTPTEKGPTKYYVKYTGPANRDQIWNEYLADQIYRELGILVPDTKIVRVEGTYGHASEMLEIDEQTDRSDLKNGFIADCLLANWDVSYNFENAKSVGGRIYRLDNGGALLFRARGQRKGEDLFGPKVNELKKGTDRERLGFGMRQEYASLTKAEIEKQARALKRKLTNSKIDELVDSVRLPQKDRDYLKQVLKARCDFIIEQYLGK